MDIHIIRPGHPLPRPLPKDGCIILVDKPLGWSSFDALAKVRGRLSRYEGVKQTKIGHAGTLDPLATGLLVFCINKYTKLIPQLQDQMKEYTGTIAVGATTPGFDLEMPCDQFFPTAHITPEAVESARRSFLGAVEQVPPIFSAVKKDGKRLYEIARAGGEVEISSKTIHIHAFDLWPSAFSPNPDTPIVDFPGKKTSLHRHPDPQGMLFFDFRVQCSKGTYIRSLARDFGLALDSGAYLSKLRRTASGSFSVSDAWTVEELARKLMINVQ